MKVTLTLDPYALTCPTCSAEPRTNCTEPNGHVRPAMHETRRRLFNVERALREGRQPNRTPEEREAFRTLVRSLHCPVCGAEPTKNCRSRKPKGRKSNHPLRTELYLASIAGRH